MIVKKNSHNATYTHTLSRRAAVKLGLGLGGMLVGTGIAQVAMADDERLSITSVENAVDNVHIFTLSNNEIGFCADHRASFPEVGRVGTVEDSSNAHWHRVRYDDSTLTGYSTIQLRMIDYILYTGMTEFKATGTAFGAYGIWTETGASKAQVCIQAALWMVNLYPADSPYLEDEAHWKWYCGNGSGPTSDIEGVTCIQRAFDEARTYAEGGAGDPRIDGCARIVRFGNDVQNIWMYVEVPQKGKASLQKQAGHADWL